MKKNIVNIFFKLTIVIFVLFTLQINKSILTLGENDMETVLVEEVENNDDFDPFELEDYCQSNIIIRCDSFDSTDSKITTHSFVFIKKLHFEADYIPPEI